ncbi:hypothetical protein [Microbacterium hominis]|uniref:DUF998 domain-containing protein n=1 Tax=Microbacterium hominis TaxID=162426 RepID=A0A7D4Q947_9MICO|nr:hypothetical protein [Microbacterium hominis]QKJ20299.1 hypothetical protein HQM25_13645 [Microbacterium hominis]
MTAAVLSTTAERTYRYLRLGLAATVVVIVVAIVVASAQVGVLPSVSHYYYSPARDAFVGALVAASLALFALSGRGPQRALLDAAALFAPLIAVVPATVVAGQVPGVGDGCDSPCLPGTTGVDADTSVAVYLVVSVLILAAGVAVLVRSRDLDRRGLTGSLLAATAIVAAIGLWWALDRASFHLYAHVVVTTAFFALFAAAPLVLAISPGQSASRGLRIGYLVVAGLLVVTGIVYLVVTVSGVSTTIPVVLVCELVALALFLMFWVLQTVQNWSDPDPTLI